MPRTTTAAAVEDYAPLVASFHRALRAEHKSPATIATYGKASTQFERYLIAQGMPRNVAGIRREHIEAFIEDLQGRVSDATVSQRFRSLQALFRWLHEEDHIPA